MTSNQSARTFSSEFRRFFIRGLAIAEPVDGCVRLHERRRETG